jgi:hypothetical protein
MEGFEKGRVSEAENGLAIGRPREEALDLLRKVVDVDWLLDVTITAGLQGAFAVSAHYVGGDGHDR